MPRNRNKHPSTACRALRRGPLLLALASLCVTASASNGQRGSGISATLWERQAAMAQVRDVDVAAASDALVAKALAGDEEALLVALEHTRQRRDWSGPARDAVIHGFIERLRDMPQAVISRQTMAYLKRYEPSTLVPRSDHPRGAEPLFNIRASAAGLDNGWRHQQGLLEALSRLQRDPQTLVDRFIDQPDRPTRRGYLSALEQASPAQLRSLSKAAEARLGSNPELTPLLARAAVLNMDSAAQLSVLSAGRGPSLARMLRAVGQTADPAARQSLLLRALDEAPVESAALAIATLGPALAGELAVDEALARVLGDSELGGNAALALAHSRRDATHALLQTIAHSDGGLRAERANLALQLRAERSVGAMP